jgi:5-methylcytosine-specific restriction endonuclease McrA
MLRVFVLDQNQNQLMPCHPARARELLGSAKARVFRLKPFTIILTDRIDGDTQAIELKVDPGSKQTGIALVGDFKRGKRAIFAVNLEHRGQNIKEALESRRAIRRSRRNRKTRYRKPRFDNRTRPKGWLPPSLMSRVANVSSWTKKIFRFTPVSEIDVETVRFDMQKMANPEISGLEYQQGELFGYEVREYLLEKWGRKCVYCDKKDTPLEVEHIVSKRGGGSNRVSNLTLACTRCNQKKGSGPVKAFVSDPIRLRKILSKARAPLTDAAAVNATRYATGNALKSFGLPIRFWSGGRTKYNRAKQGYKKDHWIDAVCVGETGEHVFISPKLKPLLIKAEGRGTRQKCRVDQFGFPRTKAKSQKRVCGFQTGDLVKAVVDKGKKKGVYVGRVAVRTTGNFNIKVNKKTIQGINARYCRLWQRTDGYSYA